MMPDSEECLTCGAALRQEDGTLQTGLEVILEDAVKRRWCYKCWGEAWVLLMRLHKEECRSREGEDDGWVGMSLQEYETLEVIKDQAKVLATVLVDVKTEFMPMGARLSQEQYFLRERVWKALTGYQNSLRKEEHDAS